MLNTIPDLYPLDVSSPYASYDNQKMSPNIAKRPLGDQIDPDWETLIYIMGVGDTQRIIQQINKRFQIVKTIIRKRVTGGNGEDYKRIYTEYTSY